MKKTLLLVLPVLISIMIVSCQKELNDPTITGYTVGTGGSGGTGGASIIGNWKFISISAVTQSTNQFSAGGITYKTITNSAYTSTNNAGTVTITSNTMASNGLSYDVSGTADAVSYENNVQVGTISQPFNVSLSSYSSVSAYKQISQDSIYFTGQGIDPSGNAGSGARIALNGNTLKLTSSVVKDTTINAGGLLAAQHSTATAVTTLQRQ
jgi:hypothetical protein